MFARDLLHKSQLSIRPCFTRCLHKRSSRNLLLSDEGQRQSSMGHHLDPSNKFAPPIPILEEIFNDSQLYSHPAIANGTAYPPITPDSPWAASSAQIKGVNAAMVSELFDQRVLRSCGVRTRNDMASFYFFPPWHPACMARKSRPSLIALRGPGEQFNGIAEAQAQAKGQKSTKNMNPMHYAVWRQRSARFYRRALFQHCQKDGMYVVVMQKVPTQEEAAQLMEQFCQKVAQSNFNWVDKQVKSLNLKAMTETVEQSGHHPEPVDSALWRASAWSRSSE